MIELPESPAPNGMVPRLTDPGFVQRGASALRINRPGSHWAFELTFPPMRPELSRRFSARLLRAKREGLRIKLPLLGEHQGIPGAPVVDGAGQAGTSLAVRGLTPGYVAKEGFWFHIVRAATGKQYLHKVFGTAITGADGKAVMQIEPALRVPFADGDMIELAAPEVEGFVDGDSWGWEVPVNRLIALAVTVEEYA